MARLEPRELVVYVPAANCAAVPTIRRGSGIVGIPEPNEADVRVYFEGNVYGSVGMERLADRAAHAFDRLRSQYPTVAVARLPKTALVDVGTFDPWQGRITPRDAEAERAIADWLDASDLDPAELQKSGAPARWLPSVGDRYRLARNVDRYPHFIAPTGATGTITQADGHGIALKLDEHLPGAETWDNEVVWAEEQVADFAVDCEREEKGAV